MGETGGEADELSGRKDLIIGVLAMSLLTGVMIWGVDRVGDRSDELKRGKAMLQIQSQGIVAGQSGHGTEHGRLVQFCPSILVLAGAGGMPAAQEREIRRAILDCRTKPTALHMANPEPRLIIDKGATAADLDLAIRLGSGGGRCAVLVPAEIPLFQGQSGINYQLDGGELPAGVCLNRTN